MTKPSDFIFNSDYLALAETNRQTFFVSVPPFSYDQDQGYDTTTYYTVDLTTKASEKSSIDEFYVTINGQTTFFGDVFVSVNSTSQVAYWFLWLQRVNKTTVRVTIMYQPAPSSQGATTPPITLNITVCSFRPPNVF
jgi:hypothetical protein